MRRKFHRLGRGLARMHWRGRRHQTALLLPSKSFSARPLHPLGIRHADRSCGGAKGCAIFLTLPRVGTPHGRPRRDMTENKTLDHAKEDLEEGKSPSTAAGEFVREEMHHIREGKHGAQSTKQAIAIGLSKARRAGVPLKPPKTGKAATKKAARSAYKAGQRHPDAKPSRTRSRATARA